MGLEENLGGKDPTRRVLATPTQRQPPGDQEVKKGKYLSYINAYEPQNTKNSILLLEYCVLFPQNQSLNNCIT